MALTPQEFVAKWQQSTLRERASAQEHFIDVCRLLGHPTPAEADPAGTWFTFEKGASKATGGQGWADVWKRGCFAWEYKGKHGDLQKAYDQLLRYSDALDNPPLLIVSDIERIRIHTRFTNTVKRVEELTLDDLLVPARLAILRQAFNDPDALKSTQTTVQVTEKAAEQFSRIAQILRRYGHESHEVAHFLIRLLFCLFAEDVGILPAGLFTRLLHQPRLQSGVFSAQLRQLFGAMADGGNFGVEIIPHVNGGLFNDAVVLPLDGDSLLVLREVARQDWSAIEPAILGTLFERGLDPEKRSQLGAHFTSKDDILLVVEPVLMRPLRDEWAKRQKLVEEALRLPDATTKVKRDHRRREVLTVLRTFREKLAALQILDAACGSGNFLYVSLRLLLDLEKEVINYAAALGDTVSFPMVSPAQFHGIELNPYACELAQATIWIGYIQWLRENGFGLPGEPILKPLDAIRQMDAILAYDAAERPVEPEWPAVDVIVGNPPFLGDKKMRGELGGHYVDDLRGVYAGRVPGGADLVTYWFEKARSQVEAGEAKRVGLLATNSIRQRGNRTVLDRIKRSGGIFLAWSDRPWVLDGADVRVSIVGFDGGTETERVLDGKRVAVVNSDLTAAADVTAAVALPENEGLCFLGVMKAGPFDIDAARAQELLTMPINPNGRPNSDVLRRRIGAQDITGRFEDRWIIDFDHLPESSAARYEGPFEYLRTHVKPIRDQNRDRGLRQRWWQHGRPRPELRAALRGLRRYIATPEVAKHRIFVWLPTSVLPDHTTHVIARDDDYFFGVLHSRSHEVWSLAQGARMGVGNDPRYSSSRTFATFPFPWPPGKESASDVRVEAIAAAARALVDERDRWLRPAGANESQLADRTLTNLYNQGPEWLKQAHARLDAAVLDAYGWPHDLGDQAILERLLELNFARAPRSDQK